MDPRSAFDRRGQVQIVDVREPHEWQAGHIEGARHIPMREITARMDELDPTKPVVAVCRSGHRSAEVTRFLLARGLDVHNLDGGVKAWTKAGLPFAGPNGSRGRVV